MMKKKKKKKKKKKNYLTITNGPYPNAPRDKHNSVPTLTVMSS